MYHDMIIHAEQLGERMPGGFFIYHADEDMEFIYVNKPVLEIFRCSTIEEFKEYTHNSFKGIVHPDDVERTQNEIDRQVVEHHNAIDHVEYRIIAKDGSVRWVDDYGRLVEDEEFGKVFFVFVSDVTQKYSKRTCQPRNAQRQTEHCKQIIYQLQIIN